MRQSNGLYMGLNTSVQQFVERLNDLNRYLLYFPEENPKQLDQDEIIEILDQAKDRGPEWHEAMLNAKIDIFEMSYYYQFHISSVWRTWRRSVTPTIQVRLQYHQVVKACRGVTSCVGKSTKNPKTSTCDFATVTS
jgi:hypothetical protein